MPLQAAGPILDAKGGRGVDVFGNVLAQPPLAHALPSHTSWRPPQKLRCARPCRRTKGCLAKRIRGGTLAVIGRMMRKAFLLTLQVMLLAAAAGAQSQRFVIDDDEYADKVVGSCTRLLTNHKLVSTTTLQRQVRLKGCAVKLAPCSRQKLSPPDLYERLRESTLAVGTFYKCPDCGGWHFNGSAGFVVAEGGVVCTCCHVVLPGDEDVKESYLVAADSAGHVFPVRSVLASDLDADTCLVQIDAALKPLPLRAGVRVGEEVFCLSHPGGYYFMFTQGMVSRLNSRRDEAVDERGQTNGALTRPVLLLN